MKIYISKKNFLALETQRHKYQLMYIKERYSAIDDHDLPKPKQWFLLGHKNEIKRLVAIHATDGCGGNIAINSKQLATIITISSDRKMEILGLARVGMFHIANRGNVSYSYQNFLGINGFIKLVFGRDGYQTRKFCDYGTEKKVQLIVEDK